VKNRLYGIAAALTVLVFALMVVSLGVATAQTTEKTTEKAVENTSEKACEDHTQATESELSASVPELGELHEVVYPLWHTAYANKDYAMIKELLPQADELTAKLDAAKLPGILRDKQDAWDKGKLELEHALQSLHVAAEKDDQEEMLKQTELFHANYEKLVRTIRPLTPELDAFHQELYKLYHYYGPQYDLENIRATAAAMVPKVEALKKSQLPKRLAEKQKDFDAGVVELEGAVNKLVETAKKDSKEEILAAVETVHSGYVKIEQMFD
jgi:hypothetical protein